MTIPEFMESNVTVECDPPSYIQSVGQVQQYGSENLGLTHDAVSAALGTTLPPLFLPIHPTLLIGPSPHYDRLVP